MPGSAGGVDESIDSRSVLMGEERTLVSDIVGCEQLQHRRGHVDQAAADIGNPEPRHPGTGDDKGCPRLHDAQRSVLSEVPTLVNPVVGRTVDHAEVRRRGMIEELGELLEGVGIAVLAAPRMPSCALGLKSDEARLVLHGKWVLTGDRHNPETPVHLGGTAELDGAVNRSDFVRSVGPRPADHVDDWIELVAQQDVERPFDVGVWSPGKAQSSPSVRLTLSGFDSMFGRLGSPRIVPAFS